MTSERRGNADTGSANTGSANTGSANTGKANTHGAAVAVTTPGIRIFGSYADILRVPGSIRFVAAGFLGRVARSTAGITTILLVAAHTGSFTLAGSVSAAIVIGIAVGGPLWSRLTDARGQRFTLPLSLIAAVVASVALVSVVTADAPLWSWFACAFLVGASSIDVGTLVRARWRSVLAGEHQRHTSLALESVSDELVFVVGPPAVTLIAATAGPVTGFAAGAAVSVVGGLWLWLQRSTAPAVVPPEQPNDPAGVAAGGSLRGAAGRAGRRLLPAGVLGMLPLYVGVGAVFASIDVGAVSVGRAAGQTWLAGVILGVFALGSVVAGFAFGPLSARWNPSTRVLVSALAYAVVVPTLLVLQNPVALASLIFVAGLVTTPVLISGTSLIASRVHERRLTEALSWPTIGMSVGVSLGGALTGLAIDHGTAFSAFMVSAVAAVGVGLFGALRALFERRAAR